jgi:mannose-6-phosphate isomerase-like protein (cupin superfamily)
METKSAAALKDRLQGCVARFADRREDWTVFGFETARNPRFARAQRRYLGASGSTDPNDLRGSIPATAFTMSIQTMPPGNRIPVHCHETQEVFFILEGECLVRCWEGEESTELKLGKWDLIALPPFLQHEVFNTGEGDCQLQTLLAKPQPLRPQYADPELLKLQAAVG